MLKKNMAHNHKIDKKSRSGIQKRNIFTTLLPFLSFILFPRVVRATKGEVKKGEEFIFGRVSFVGLFSLIFLL